MVGLQFGDPFAKSPDVFVVVIATRLADPPRGFIGGAMKERPLLDHPGPAGVGLDPRDIPWLVLHGREERGVELIHVDVVALVRADADALELNLCLREPRAEVGDDVAHGPVGVAVVARFEAFLGRQRPDEVDQLVPALPLGLDLGGIRVIRKNAGGGCLRVGHGASTNSPSSGRPESSHSRRPPE
jgi:hypothetical protein